LQVLNKTGDWIDVPNIPGTLVVNIGQAFEVVTNGVCKATTHRVLGGTSERFSVPFFQGVRRNLTKAEAIETLRDHFLSEEFQSEAPVKGKYETWGESQLRTKVRSHRDVGRRFYGEVYEKYVSDN
jgi:isopenicillin N synthase-like dioxygenase